MQVRQVKRRRWIGVLASGWALAVFCLGQISGQSIQSAGFTNPAVVEIVFPYVVFGDTPTGRLVSEIVVVNLSSTPADVRIDLFDQQGRTPALRLASGELVPGRDPEFNTVAFAYRNRIPAGDVATFSYPNPTYTFLLDPAFAGWAILRSTVPVHAYQRIQVLNPINLRVASETIFFWGRHCGHPG